MVGEGQLLNSTFAWTWTGRTTWFKLSKWCPTIVFLSCPSMPVLSAGVWPPLFQHVGSALTNGMMLIHATLGQKLSRTTSPSSTVSGLEWEPWCSKVRPAPPPAPPPLLVLLYAHVACFSIDRCKMNVVRGKSLGARDVIQCLLSFMVTSSSRAPRTCCHHTMTSKDIAFEMGGEGVSRQSLKSLSRSASLSLPLERIFRAEARPTSLW